MNCRESWNKVCRSGMTRSQITLQYSTSMTACHVVICWRSRPLATRQFSSNTAADLACLSVSWPTSLSRRWRFLGVIDKDGKQDDREPTTRPATPDSGRTVDILRMLCPALRSAAKLLLIPLPSAPRLFRVRLVTTYSFMTPQKSTKFYYVRRRRIGGSSQLRWASRSTRRESNAVWRVHANRQMFNRRVI